MPGNSRRRTGDYRGMDCETYRLGISARLDGEDAGFDDAALAWHLASCEACRRFESEAIQLTRAVRVASAESAHLLDLMGLASVWELARTDGPPRPEGHRGHGRLTPVR